ncbi:MAG TPA: hypothetical protein DEH78_26515 [Solibacterales bacterium]|nr:hypothetical protein [Bryobacterales bacterium]
MLSLLWRFTRGYRLTPWRSPYLRWRMETYWGIPSDAIGFREFWRFSWRHRGELVRFLHWAVRMER